MGAPGNLAGYGFSIGVLLGIASVATAAGPASKYYLTDGDASVVQVVQSEAIVDSWATTTPRLYPLAVTDTIKLYPRGSDTLGDGIEYALDGTPTGTTFPWQNGPTGQLLDGATDGLAHNYAGELDGGLGVWQFDPDWTNPVRLFTTPMSTIGITYDGVADTLWIAQDEGNIQQVANDGTVLSEFSPSEGGQQLEGRWGALAWEPATDTLWAHLDEDNNTTDHDVHLRQWSKDGTLLQEVEIADLSWSIFGGEFQMISEVPPLLGDVNGDGDVNGLDVAPFTALVTAGTYQVEADMNEDGSVNGLDVEPFVEVVIGGGVQAVPEPSTLVLVGFCLVAWLAFLAIGRVKRAAERPR